jgi:hypothetical protein
MPKRDDYLAKKKREIRRDIDGLHSHTIVVQRTGGTTTHSLQGEIDFQQKRLDVITWAEQATEGELVAELARMRAVLGPEGDAILTSGILRGLPEAFAGDVAKTALLEHALGEHAIRRRP